MTLETQRLLLAALRRACICEHDAVKSPVCWQTGIRIPHHTCCPMFIVELPPETAVAAYADALDQRRRALAGDP